MNQLNREAPAQGEVIVYRAKDGKVSVVVKLHQETVWLSQKQIADLFGTQRPAITKHLSNIFQSKELEENSVCSILEHTASDGKTYKTAFYNLDAIISVGFLEKNALLYKADGTKRIADNALVAFTLLIAESDPDERDVIVTLVVNLINKHN